MEQSRRPETEVESSFSSVEGIARECAEKIHQFLRGGDSVDSYLVERATHIITTVLTGCEPWRLGVEQAAKVGYQVVTDHAEGNKIQVSVLAHKVQEACRALLPDGVAAPVNEVSQALAELREMIPTGYVAVRVSGSGFAHEEIPRGAMVRVNNDQWDKPTLAEAMAAVRESLPVQTQEGKQ